MKTVHFTTRSIDEPERASSRRMFSRVWRVCGWIPPTASWPVLSVPSWPARKRNPFARTAGENGRGAPVAGTNSGPRAAAAQPAAPSSSPTINVIFSIGFLAE
jgi:hypothetical protein